MSRDRASVVYVDVDDTLVRSASTKRIPIPNAINRVRALYQAGATLYLWSTAGGEYAESTAKELGLSECFRGYLPKPDVIIDDQHMTEWRGLEHEYPAGPATPPGDLRIVPGEIYEDGAYHPCLCVNVIDGEADGISLIDGSYSRACDLRVGGARKLSPEEAFLIRTTGPIEQEDRERIPPERRWWR